MQRLSRTKECKTHNYMCQMEEPGAYKALSAVGKFASGGASPESDSHASMRWCMEEFIEEKIIAWRCVDHCLMSGFLPASRSRPGAPSGGVADRRWSSHRKNSPENFPISRGGLMAAKDSKDGGELAEV